MTTPKREGATREAAPPTQCPFCKRPIEFAGENGWKHVNLADSNCSGVRDIPWPEAAPPASAPGVTPTQTEEDEDDDSLKPCPFCGCEFVEMVEIEEGENAGANFIECTKCGASTNLQFSLKPQELEYQVGCFSGSL
jgi:hypothetical protein